MLNKILKNYYETLKLSTKFQLMAMKTLQKEYCLLIAQLLFQHVFEIGVYPIPFFGGIHI